MKLQVYWINVNVLQDYLDKYQDKIKFIIPCIYMSNQSSLLLVIDES